MGTDEGPGGSPSPLDGEGSPREPEDRRTRRAAAGRPAPRGLERRGACTQGSRRGRTAREAGRKRRAILRRRLSGTRRKPEPMGPVPVSSWSACASRWEARRATRRRARSTSAWSGCSAGAVEVGICLHGIQHDARHGIDAPRRKPLAHMCARTGRSLERQRPPREGRPRARHVHSPPPARQKRKQTIPTLVVGDDESRAGEVCSLAPGFWCGRTKRTPQQGGDLELAVLLIRPDRGFHPLKPPSGYIDDADGREGRESAYPEPLHPR